mgnify:CR=1 FL=1
MARPALHPLTSTTNKIIHQLTNVTQKYLNCNITQISKHQVYSYFLPISTVDSAKCFKIYHYQIDGIWCETTIQNRRSACSANVPLETLLDLTLYTILQKTTTLPIFHFRKYIGYQLWWPLRVSQMIPPGGPLKWTACGWGYNQKKEKQYDSINDYTAQGVLTGLRAAVESFSSYLNFKFDRSCSFDWILF